MTNPVAVCAQCRFWEKDPQRDGRGKCRRRAPVFHPLAKVYEFSGRDPLEGMWPETDESEWCAEFHPRS